MNAALWGETFEGAPDGMKYRDRLVEWAKGLVKRRIEFATFLCVLGRLPHPMARVDRRSVAKYLGIPFGRPARLVREFYESCLRLKESKRAALPGDDGQRALKKISDAEREDLAALTTTGATSFVAPLTSSRG